MPHLTLEHTGNVDPNVEFEAVFLRLHSVLADAGIKLANCKSRATVRDLFYVANGTGSSAFVHLDVRFMEGVPGESKQEIGEGVLAVLRDCFGAPPGIDDFQITVEIRDIERDAYFKFPAGTLNYR